MRALTKTGAARELFGDGTLEDDLLLGDRDALVEAWMPNEWVADPVGWIEQEEFLWSKQQVIAESVAVHRHTAVPSAHGPGKSFTAARLACWWLDVHPIGEAFVVTTAPTWNQVHAILWREIRRSKALRELAGRTTLDARWYMGGRRIGDEDEQLVAYGRKPADYDQAAFQGIHARYVLVIIDEGSGVPKLLYDAVDSLATNRNARVLAIGNPDDPASEFAKICRPGSGWNVIPVSAFDTPAFTGEEVPQQLLDLLPSKEWVEERKERWGEESPIYQSKVLGIFPDIGEDTLIEPRLIKLAEAADLARPKTALGQDGWDIARYGSDRTVGYNCAEGVIRKVYEGTKQSTMSTAGRIHQRVEPHKGGLKALVDVVGLGSGVVDRLREQRVRGIVAFNAGAKAIDPMRFADRRAELFWGFREAMEAGAIDLPPEGEDDDLKGQLGSLKWKVESNGKVRVESKEDMKRRGLPSPDHADAAVMSWAPDPLSLPTAEERRAAAEEVGEETTLTGDLLTREL